MKISNSKKELARIISENGGWREGSGFAAQDQNAAVTFFVDTPWRCDTVWECDNFESVDGFAVSEIALKNWHQTILSRAEYFHLYPAPDANGWIEWKGGECPVGAFDVIEVRYRDYFNEVNHIGQSRVYDWIHHGSQTDIIAYRLHKPERENPESCEPVMSALIGVDMASGSDSTAPFTVNAKPTIEQLATDYRNAKDYAERKQKEADDAKADAESKLAELAAAGKVLGLVLSVAGVEPELVITDWSDLRGGDLVWVEEESGRVVEGEYEVLEVEAPGYDGKRTIRIRGGEGGKFWINYENGWRLIRRP